MRARYILLTKRLNDNEFIARAWLWQALQIVAGLVKRHELPCILQVFLSLLHQGFKV